MTEPNKLFVDTPRMVAWWMRLQGENEVVHSVPGVHRALVGMVPDLVVVCEPLCNARSLAKILRACLDRSLPYIAVHARCNTAQCEQGMIDLTFSAYEQLMPILMDVMTHAEKKRSQAMADINAIIDQALAQPQQELVSHWRQYRDQCNLALIDETNRKRVKQILLATVYVAAWKMQRYDLALQIKQYFLTADVGGTETQLMKIAENASASRSIGDEAGIRYGRIYGRRAE